ncbi:MAG: YebC/PmpR family DNA-binding transcriptional regulator [Gammaproteobacteria bacterium]|nr:YebC/PmpR family DNA-binding transcriptional regulator [Gammaproteobacteria bacterium]
MAGHSKWANIQHRKGAQDKKRGKVFTKHIREITVAARAGGGDVAANPSLRLAIDKALGANMTKDTIERAVRRGSGDLDGENYEEVRYEGYGPGGTAVIVDCMTDNRNRTVAEVRHAFSKHGGNMGTSGSVAYLFSQIGVLVYPPESDEDAIMEQALEVGAEDVVSHDDGSIEVVTSFEDFTRVNEAMTAAGLEPAMSEVTMRASLAAALDFDGAESLMKLIDRLEDLDDVQDVYSNAEISDEIMASLDN